MRISPILGKFCMHFSICIFDAKCNRCVYWSWICFFKFEQSTIWRFWRCHRRRRCRRWSTRNGAWLDTPHFYSNAFIQCWYFDVYILYRRTLCGIDIPSHSKGTHPSVELYCTVLCCAVPCRAVCIRVLHTFDTRHSVRLSLTLCVNMLFVWYNWVEFSSYVDSMNARH